MKIRNRILFGSLIFFEFLPGGFAANDTGLFHNPKLLARWQEQLQKYVDPGTFPVNAVIPFSQIKNYDTSRIKAYADAFVSRTTPSYETATSSGPTSDLWKGNATPDQAVSSPYRQYPVWAGVQMQAAAFMYLLLKDSQPANALTYGNAVHRALMQQIAEPAAMLSKWIFAAPPGGYVASPTASQFYVWFPSTGKPNLEAGANESLWVTRLLRAYDFTKNLYTPSETTALQNWFTGAANVMAGHINEQLKVFFPNRLANDYSVVATDAKPNGNGFYTFSSTQCAKGANPTNLLCQREAFCALPANQVTCQKYLPYPTAFDATNTYNKYPNAFGYFIYTHVNGLAVPRNRLSYLSINWNNRRSDKTNMFGQVGALFRNANLISQAKLYTKEWLKYAVFADGMQSESSRNGDYGNAAQGSLNYGAKNIAQAVELAYALANYQNDFELFNYSTTEGLHGTEVTSGPAKTLKTPLTRYATLASNFDPGYFGWVAVDTLMGISQLNLNLTRTGFSRNGNPTNETATTWDQLLAIANAYYNDSYLTGVYSRNPVLAPGIMPYGNFLQSNRKRLDFTSSGGTWLNWNGPSAEFPGTLFMFANNEDLGLKPNQPPSVSSFTTNLVISDLAQDYPFSATVLANDPENGLSKIELLVDGVPVQQASKSPAAFTLTNLAPGARQLQARVTDDQGLTAVSTVQSVTIRPACASSGGVVAQIWSDTRSGGIDPTLYGTAPSLTLSLTQLELPVNRDDQFQSRIQGYFCPPVSGNYTFDFASDDQGELYLSPNNSPSGISRIAYVGGYTGAKQYTKYASQKSAAISLLAGNQYYFETRHREGTGSDNLSVRWTRPDGVIEDSIPGSRLSKY